MSTYTDLEPGELYLRAQRLSPATLRSYLSDSGWAERRTGSPYLTAWERPGFRGEGVRRVFLPLSGQFGDFGTQMAILLQDLAEAEGQPVRRLLEALTPSPFLTHRFRLMADSASGTLPLDQGWRLHKAAHDVILAGAVTAAYSDGSPLVHPANKPVQARRFLQSSLLAPSETGSYVMVVRTPRELEPDTPSRRGNHEQAPLFGLDPHQESTPFGAAVAQSLLGALAAAQEALRVNTESAAHSRLPKKLVAGLLGQGLSANLCEALADLGGTGVRSNRFDTELTIAVPEGAGPASTTTPFSFTAGDSLQLKHLSELMKKQYRNEPVVLYGTIQNLDRPNPAGRGPGVVTVYGRLEHEFGHPPRRFRVHLDEDDYSRATRAHDDGNEVRVRGALAPSGTRQHIHDAHLSVIRPTARKTGQGQA